MAKAFVVSFASAIIYIFMRNNSLKNTSNCHRQPQQRIAHKISKFLQEESSANKYSKEINDCTQHSELKWLEKVVGEIKSYKLEEEKVGERGKINHSVSYGDRKPLEKGFALNLNVSMKDRIREEMKNGAQKGLKFQVVSSNKQNKPPSARKSSNYQKSSHSKIKSAKKKSQIAVQDDSIKKKQRQPLSCHDSLKKECIFIQNTLTDPCEKDKKEKIYEKDNILIDDLWFKKDSLRNSVFEQGSEQKVRKSVGKIVKNSNQKQDKIEQQQKSLSISKEKKEKVEKVSSVKPQKVFIKLETQNLSKYLNQNEPSMKNDEFQSKQINQSQEQKKICITKRSLYKSKRAKYDFSPKTSIILNEKTQKILRKKNNDENKMTIDSGRSIRTLESARNRSNSSLGRGKNSGRRKMGSISKRNRVIERVRSEQRKLNKTAQIVKQKINIETEQLAIGSIGVKEKPGRKEERQTFEVEVNDFRHKTDEKKVNTKKKDEPRVIKMNQHKLFTLQSVHSDKDKEMEQSFNLSQDSSVDPKTKSPSYHQRSQNEEEKKVIQELICSSIKLTDQIEKIESKQLPPLQMSIAQPSKAVYSSPIRKQIQPSPMKEALQKVYIKTSTFVTSLVKEIDQIPTKSHHPESRSQKKQIQSIPQRSSLNSLPSNDQKTQTSSKTSATTSQNKESTEVMKHQPELMLIPPSLLSTKANSHQDDQQLYLTRLFEELDESNLKLLTSSNCFIENLTEEIKILFSSILHQIRTKKQTYSLQNFITQCHEVIKIKKEVYEANQNHLKGNIRTILRTNYTKLQNKKALDKLVKHTITPTETVQNSKRQSVFDSQSIVVAKMNFKQPPAQKQHTYRQIPLEIAPPRPPLQEISMDQPQLYFQKKYNITPSAPCPPLTSNTRFSTEKQNITRYHPSIPQV